MDWTTLHKFQHFYSEEHFGTENVYSIDAYIDKKKLLYQDKLCEMNECYLSKKIFMIRLFSFMLDNRHKHYGFIPNIVDILGKYGLLGYLLDYTLDDYFPSKPVWKSVLNSAIDEKQTSDWNNSINSDSDFSRFWNLHHRIQ